MAYTPASNTTLTTNLAHLQAVLYRKRGLNRLMKKFQFRKACMKDSLEMASGKTVQFFRYTNLSTNTTVTTEGAVGTGQALTSKILQATVSQYSAFITVSNLLKATAIDPIVQNAAELLGYQAGYSVDTMTRGVIDTESASTDQSLLATYLKVADLRNARSQLQASDVQPMEEDNRFLVIAHPYATFDLVNDPAASGLADIFKYNTNVTNSPLVTYEDRGFVVDVAGCRVIESTNVRTGTGPNTYRVYVFGKEGVGAVDLSGMAPSDIVDPAKQRFKINVIQGQPSIADPEGNIGAAVSYNFAFTTVVLDGPGSVGGTYRYKTLDPQSTIG